MWSNIVCWITIDIKWLSIWGPEVFFEEACQSTFLVDSLVMVSTIYWPIDVYYDAIMHDTSSNGCTSTHCRQAAGYWMDVHFCSVPSMRATTTSSGAPLATTAVPNLASFTGLRHIGSKHNRCFHLSNRISATRCVI